MHGGEDLFDFFDTGIGPVEFDAEVGFGEIDGIKGVGFGDFLDIGVGGEAHAIGSSGALW